MADYRSACSAVGCEYTGESDSNLYFSHLGFEFYCRKVSFPPSNLNTDKLINQEDKQGYIKAKLSKIHGGKYAYDNMVYTSCRDYIIVTCKEHGDFKVLYTNHLKGRGCKFCAGDLKSSMFRKSSSEFIEQAKQVHGNRYDYSKVVYHNNRKQVIIGCEVHGEFLQAPVVHLRAGCPKCGDLEATKKKLAKGVCGFSRSSYSATTDNSYLYLIRISKGLEVFYKVGITKDLQARFKGLCSKTGYAISFLFFKEFDASSAFYLEKELHKQFKQFKITPSLKFSGYTECFSKVSIKDFLETCRKY